VNTDRPVFEREEVDLESSIDTALASRSEMSVARQVVKNRELNERVAYRQKRHQLDFNVNYGPQGASLDTPLIISPIGVVPPNQGSLGDSLSNIFSGDVYSWTTTLTYRVPIANRAAKANYTKSQLALQQSEVDLRNQEQTIRVEVRRAVRGVESGIKRVEAARKNVELQEEKLEAEQKKFDNGMSTSFEVLTFQNDLADAELSEIRARLDYLKSLTALERAEGTLLESHRLRLSK
jgi:outer membrane protein TolC